MLNDFIKKRIEFNFSGLKLGFDVSQSLFSSFQIDIGTQALLNSLRKNTAINYDTILDLGCGYGVMAIFLKKQNPNSEVYATDRDVLAVEFTKHNAKLNNCEVHAFTGLDYSNIENGKKFDLIICNFPAKAEINGLKRFVYNASEHLSEEGIFALVIVKELEDDFKKILRDEINIVSSEKKPGYFIYHLKFNKKISYDEDAYIRNNVELKLERMKYFMKTARGISEFESPSYSTIGVLEMLKTLSSKKTVLINPSQGYIALGIHHYLRPEKLHIVSRDLLELKFTKSNLLENGFEEPESIESYYLNKELGDLLVWNLEDEDDELIKKQFETLKKLYLRIIIAGKKKNIERLEKKEKIKISKEIIKKNFKIILIELPTE